LSESIDDLFARYGPAYRWLATATGMLGFFSVVFSATIVNVAVPEVMGAFGVGQDKAQFLATAFLATMTASLLLNAWIVDRLGQRYAFLLALAGFAAGSVLSATAVTLELVIFGRAIQGLFSGFVQPLVMVLIFQVFPPHRRGFAMGIFSMGTVFALGVAPAFGGLLIDAFNWRWVFLAPMPMMAAAFFLGFLFIPSQRKSSPAAPFDWSGYSFLCVAMFAVVTAISSGQREGWTSDGILGWFALTFVSGAGFVFSQLRPDAGLLNLKLFRNTRFSLSIMLALAFGIGNFSTIYLMPVFGQIIQQYTPTEAGLLLMPGSLLAMLLLPMSGRMSDIFQPHKVIMVGLVMFAAGAWLMATADTHTMFWTVAGFILISRVGLALVNPSLNTAAMQSLPLQNLQQGAGILSFAMLLGGAVGINALVVILEQRTQMHADALTLTQTAANAVTREMLETVQAMLGAAGVPEALQQSAALHYLGRVVTAQADTLGFQDGFMAIALLFIAALIPAWLFGRARSETGR